MSNPFAHIITDLKVDDKTYKYFDLTKLNDDRIKSLPYSIRVLLESALRHADDFVVTKDHIETILDWQNTRTAQKDIPFHPARVILQDFTGVPCVVDLAAMRDAVQDLGGDVSKINPLIPVDLVIDHSVQVDHTRGPDAIERNLEREMERNSERFQFLKWGSKSFDNLQIIPPGSGIVHQVNLEYLARVVMADKNDNLYFDSVVGTDSHTTMSNALLVSWGVGGLEGENAMLGEPLVMVLPEVVGVKLTGSLPPTATATDLVLELTKRLRQKGVVGKFVEFFGEGIASLSLADRATISNMAPEYGSTIGYFPIDERAMDYISQTGRDQHTCDRIRAYMEAQQAFVNYKTQEWPTYPDVMELNLEDIVPTVAGPKRPHDAVAVSAMKTDFNACLSNPVGFKGFGLSEEEITKKSSITFEGKDYELTHGSVVIAAITSCTNTSNPSVLIAAGLLAKNAVAKGLNTLPYIKTSLAPGSHVVTKYLEAAGLQTYLDQIGFSTVGYGCTTCIGNSGEIPVVVEDAITNDNLVASAVLSGNRNFEGRVHPSTRANYLASPPLVVAYALAGTVDIDFETTPIGHDSTGSPVFLKDLWPSKAEIDRIEKECVTSKMFQDVYSTITQGSKAWQRLQAEETKLYGWGEDSTYIHQPPFFAGLPKEPAAQPQPITKAYALLNLGDSITTDHISPAGNIARTSPAAQFLISRDVKPSEFNSYGSRRGNDLVMTRGTYANARLINKLMNGKVGPKTIHVPSGEEMAIFDAAEKYKAENHHLIVLGGSLFGSGSSRDWAAKGPYLLGVKSVIAQSFERIHRSNLVGMGVLPLEFMEGESADVLGLNGKEQFTIELPATLGVNDIVTVKVEGGAGVCTEFKAKTRIDTPIETQYYRHGGILQYVVRKLAQ